MKAFCHPTKDVFGVYSKEKHLSSGLPPRQAQESTARVLLQRHPRALIYHIRARIQKLSLHCIEGFSLGALFNFLDLLHRQLGLKLRAQLLAARVSIQRGGRMLHNVYDQLQRPSIESVFYLQRRDAG